MLYAVAGGSFKRSAFGMNCAVADGRMGDDAVSINAFEAIHP